MRWTPIGGWRDWLALMRVDRPVGYWLLLWPTWIGLFAAPGRPDWALFVVFMLGAILMRSAGCVINDFADRRFDPHVARTRTRPIASGRIAPGAALVGFGAMLLVGLLLLAALPARVWGLALVAAALAAIYPFTKRWIDHPQLVLGVAFGWGGVMAWAAAGGPLTHPAPWLLLVANACWTLAYDTAYALGDRDDDARIGVRSTARRWGARSIDAIAALAAAALVWWAAAWVSLGAGGWAWLGWAVALVVQARLVRRLVIGGEGAGMAFFLASHRVGLALALGWIAQDLWGG